MGQAFLRQLRIGQPQVVDEQGVGRRMEACQGPAHRESGGSHDPQAVDVQRLHDSNRRRECTAQDAGKKPLALRGRQLLGVANPFQVREEVGIVCGESDGSGNQGAGPWAAASLVEAGHNMKTLRPETQLKVQGWYDLPCRQGRELALFLQAGRFALALAQEVEPGAPDVAMA